MLSTDSVKATELSIERSIEQLLILPFLQFPHTLIKTQKHTMTHLPHAGNKSLKSPVRILHPIFKLVYTLYGMFNILYINRLTQFTCSPTRAALPSTPFKIDSPIMPVRIADDDY